MIDNNKIYESLPFLSENGHVVSFVGGGGKTSLMYGFANWAQQHGKKVLVTTTTHIFCPPEEHWAKTFDEVKNCWKKGQYAVIGTLSNHQKLAQPEDAFFKEAMEAADLVLIEADGAKGCPCKVPIEKEPVLLSACDIVIGVMGLDALHEPIENKCFRLEQLKCFLKNVHRQGAQSLNQKDNSYCLTEEDAAEILTSEAGTRKNVANRQFYIFLNKCDDEKQLVSAKKICTILEQKKKQNANLYEKVYISCAKMKKTRST